MHTLIRTVETDNRGQFRIDGLEWGSYVLYAGKRSEWYPDTRYPLYRIRPAPKVMLSAKHLTAYAKVIIGPKAGVLVLSVRDAVTDHPVASQLLLRKADGSASMSMTATPEVLIPANTDVLLEVREPGFKPWIYGTPSKHSLCLGSGERMVIDVRLTPSEKPAAGMSWLPDFPGTPVTFFELSSEPASSK